MVNWIETQEKDGRTAYINADHIVSASAAFVSGRFILVTTDGRQWIIDAPNPTIKKRLGIS